MLSWGTGVIGAIRSMLRKSIIARVRAALTLFAAVMTVTVTGAAIRPAEALALLAAVYARYTEGLETTDLKAARRLLDALAQSADP